MKYAKDDRKYPCTCSKATEQGYYNLGCIVHDELAFRRHVLKLIEKKKELPYGGGSL